MEVSMKVSKAVLPVAWAAGALALASAPALASVSDVGAAPAVHGLSSIQGMAVHLDAFGRPSLDGLDVGSLIPDAKKHDLKKTAAVNVLQCNDGCHPD
jgi:hypothetical protein